MAFRRRAAAALTIALALVSSSALAQQPKPKAPPKTDMEIDPDKPKEPPPPLPPVEPGQWGVGGKEEEGRFAPPGDKKKKEEAETRLEKQKEEDHKPVDLGPKRSASLDTVVGFGSFRDIVHDAPNEAGRTNTTGASFIFGFSWRFADIWTVGARIPFTRAKIDGPQPGGPYNTFALGNLELLVRPSFQLTRTLRLPAQFSFVIPSAQGDMFPDPSRSDKNVAKAQALENVAASYARGWEETPLFANRRLGFRLGAGITWDSGGFHAGAETKFDLMIRIAGGDPYPENAKTDAMPILHTVTFAWVTGGSFGYGFFDRMLEPTLRAWFVYANAPITTQAKDYGGPQLVLEPQVNGRFPVNADKSMAVKAGIGLILPVAGPLGGQFDAAIKGFRINAAFEF